jgi:heparin binding hemagglutinin HbhA
MAFPHSIEKAREDLRKTLSDPTAPLYAVVGIADAAAASLRTARAGLDPKAIGDLARARISARLDSVQTEVLAAPGQVRALPSRASALVDEALTGALTTYSDFAGRGRTFVRRVRRQQATSELGHQAKATASKVKAATTTTKNSAAATRTTAKSAATSTKKSASAARTAAKSAATSTRKTAAAAKKAGKATSAKLGT